MHCFSGRDKLPEFSIDQYPEGRQTWWFGLHKSAPGHEARERGGRQKWRVDGTCESSMRLPPFSALIQAFQGHWWSGVEWQAYRAWGIWTLQSLNVQQKTKHFSPLVESPLVVFTVQDNTCKWTQESIDEKSLFTDTVKWKELKGRGVSWAGAKTKRNNL